MEKQVKFIGTQEQLEEFAFGEKKMRVFKYHFGKKTYAVAAMSFDEADAFMLDLNDGECTAVNVIPESEWDNNIIDVFEDNDISKKPYKTSIRQNITGTHPQLIYVKNKIKSFD